MSNSLVIFSSFLLLLVAVIIPANTDSAENRAPVSLILVNGRIWTGDAVNPWAEAVAVFQDKIVRVGSSGEISRLKFEYTRTIDLKGRLLLPGFTDSHVHFTSGGFWLSGVHLKDSKSLEEFGERLRRKAAELPPGAWITGGNWDHENWEGSPLPTKELIDRYVPDRPVFVSRYDGHMGVANSLALEIAGINENTPDPPGGLIVRKPGSREPAGVLKDAAESLLSGKIPDPSETEAMQATEAALAAARGYGITGVKYMGASMEDIQIYQTLLDTDRMTLRMEANVPLSRWRELKKTGLQESYNGGLLKLGRLKAFVDGSLGSSTALFFEPYEGQPENTGLMVNTKEHLLNEMIAADKEGFTFAIHAIGDKAVSILLDIFSEIEQANGRRDRRWSVEHAQHIAPKDFRRFPALGAIASVQPYHAIDDGRWAESRIGYERCRTTHPYRTFLDTGATLIFGSDWTVAPLDPLTGIHAAVTRRTLDGKNPGGWIPEEKISVEEAVRSYTVTPAYAGFDEQILGTISPGKYADMVILSKDIFTIDAEEILNTKVDCTIFGGKIVFER